MIKPDAYTNIGKILDIIHQRGFIVSKLKMSRFTVNDASEFYGEHSSKPFFQGLIDFVTSDVVVGMELVSDGSVNKWRETLGPTNTLEAKASAPDSLRG